MVISNDTLAKDTEKNAHIIEEHDVSVAEEGAPVLKRKLKNRHIQMISIGGVIGTGLFLGTANALRHGGPLGLLMGYSVMGTIVFCVMICLGEMISHLPVTGGHITLADRFVDRSLSFTMGWNYWYNWTIVLPAELVAAAVLISYWNDSVNNAVWITICLAVAVAINLAGTGAYGEMEFWFAIIKVLTIVGLIIMGIVLAAGGGPHGGAIGFRYWHNPGPLVQYNDIPGALGRFLGFWSVLIQAAFSFIGTEIVAIAAGEAKDPKKNLPKAIKRVYIRIILFYVLGVFVMGMICPSNEPRLNLSSGTAASSPFVIAINIAGIKTLPSIVNACLLTSAWSAASSDLYTSSRALYGLSINGSAPKILKKINRYGLPWVCVCVGIAFSFLSYMSAGSDSAGKVFGWFANMTSVCGLLNWWGISLIYIRFYNGTRRQDINRREFPFWSRLQPYAAYYSFFWCTVILFFNGYSVFLSHPGEAFDKATFITSYMPIWLFPVLYFGHKILSRSKIIKTVDMDFVTGSRVEGYNEEDAPVKKPKNLIQKIWAAIM